MSYIKTSNDLEKQTIRLLKKIGFKDVDGGINFKIGGRQIDACGGHEETLLIVECTTQSDVNKKIDEFRGKINSVISGFKTHTKYKKYKNFKLVMVVGDTDITQAHIQRANAQKPEVYLWDTKFTNYYDTLIKSIDTRARYSLLADLGVKPVAKETINVPAFSVNIGSKKYGLFLFFADVHDLLRVAYVARRDAGGGTYYQRMVQKSRLKTIARYVEKGKIFPNSIIVALDKGSFKFKNLTPDFNKLESNVQIPNWEQVGTLTIGDSFNSCWVIDGQHRLFSYAHTGVPGFLPVAAFAEINEESQAEYFLDINREAKPVSPDLLWDLSGSINPNSSKGIISNSVKAMYATKAGFFDHKVNIPSLGKGKFRFNNLCVTLEKSELAEETIGTSKSKKSKNPFWNKDADKFSVTLAKYLDQFFIELDKGINQSVKKDLYTDGLLSVLITIYKYFIAFIIKRPTDTDLRSFLDPLWQYFNALDAEGIKVLKKNLSSEGGKLDFRNQLIRVIQEGYDKGFGLGIVSQVKTLAEQINDLEFYLNKWVNSIMEKEVGSDWYIKQSYIPDPAKRKSILERAKRQNRPPWEFMDFNVAIQILSNNDVWNKHVKDIFIAESITTQNELKVMAGKLWDYRSNKVGHKRSHVVMYPRDAENIIKSYYRIISKITLREIEKLPD